MEGRGEWRGGGGGRGPAQAPHRLCAPPSPRPLTPGQPPPPPPLQDGKTALDYAKEKKYTELVRLLEDPAVYLAAQVGRAVP